MSWDILVYWGLTSVRYVHGLWHDPDLTADVSDLLDRGDGRKHRSRSIRRRPTAAKGDQRDIDTLRLAIVDRMPLAEEALYRLPGDHPARATMPA